MPAKTLIGNSEIRKDAHAKVTGRAQYIDDLPVDGLLHGMVLRSPHHHARIVNIDTAAAKALPGVVTVITSADVPGVKLFGALVPDRPALAVDVVRHIGEPVAVRGKAGARRGDQSPPLTVRQSLGLRAREVGEQTVERRAIDPVRRLAAGRGPILRGSARDQGHGPCGRDRQKPRRETLSTTAVPHSPFVPVSHARLLRRTT